MLWSCAAAAPALLTLALLLLSLFALFAERKLIAVAQKRLGISFLGRNGWAHLPADLLKFWLKHTGRHRSGWNTASAGLTGLILAYFSWSLLGGLFFAADGGSALVDGWAYQLLAYLGYANLSAIFMFQIVVGLKSKYAVLGGARILLVSVFVEVFFTLGFLCLFAHAGGFSVDALNAASRTAWLGSALPPLGLVFFLYALFEAKRAPFDHSEAESELVAGHLVEFGGRALLFFYLAEYAHLYVCVFAVVVFSLGGLAPFSPLALQPFWADVILTFALCG